MSIEHFLKTNAPKTPSPRDGEKERIFRRIRETEREIEKKPFLIFPVRWALPATVGLAVILATLFFVPLFYPEDVTKEIALETFVGEMLENAYEIDESEEWTGSHYAYLAERVSEDRAIESFMDETLGDVWYGENGEAELN